MARTSSNLGSEFKEQIKKIGKARWYQKPWGILLLGIIASFIAMILFVFTPQKEQIIVSKPSLDFNNVEFIYYDLNNHPIQNRENTKYIMNLNEVASVDFIGEIENNGEVNLLTSLKNVSLQSSDGYIIYDEPPFRVTDNTPLAKKEKYWIRMKGIDAKWFLDKLKNNEKFYLIFKPEIEYFTEDRPEEKFYLNIIIKCGNDFGGNQLPLFTPVCVPEKI